MCGNTPSSMPVRNTTGNSSPFAVCSVISVTALCSAASLGIGGVQVGDQRDRLEERLDPRRGRRGSAMSPAASSAVPTPAMPGRPETSPASSAWSNSRQTPTSSCRFSMRPARLDRPLGLELGEVAGLLEDRLDRRPIPPRGDGLEPGHELEQVADAAERLAASLRRRRRARSASRNVMPAPCAYAATLLTDVSPTPRLGVLTTRRQLTSSSGFTSARRYARTSFTSRRS